MVLGAVEGIDESYVGSLHLIQVLLVLSLQFRLKILFNLPSKSLLSNLLQKWELRFAGVLTEPLSSLCSGL